MSTNKSEHLKLHLWEPEDNFLRTEFNENFSALDGAVAGETAARVSAIRAEQEARASAIQEVKDSISAAGGTASTAVSQLRTELKQEIGAAQAAANAAQATAANAYCPENPYYIQYNYVGTGTFGKNSPCTFTTGFRPSLLAVSGPGGVNFMVVYPSTSAGVRLSVSWQEDGVSWISSTSAASQLNEEGLEYACIAFR